MKRDLALYLHFPFCKQKCYYCDFNSYGGRDDLIAPYGEALLQEVERYLPQQRPISSIYCGGGTPSYFPVQFLAKILGVLKKEFPTTSQTEITLEANPGTVTCEGLLTLYESGFNRLSLGLQAWQDDLLQRIGRIHHRSDFEAAFHLAREIGFANINVDLIFGLPGQTAEAWRQSLEAVVAIGPEHISAYGLQLENGTPLAQMVDRGELQLPEEEETVAMMQMAMEFLPENGYEHYEISNYAKPGLYSHHNLAYWHGQDYLGFGAGATSTIYGERCTNVKDPATYVALLRKDAAVIAERESIDRHTAAVEALMLGLRLRRGVDFAEFQRDWGINLRVRLSEPLQALLSQNLLATTAGRLFLTDSGILLSNQVIGRLIREL